MRRRWLVASLALLVMASPSTLQIRQAGISAQQRDEGEFDLRITAPEGTGLARSMM